MKPQPTGANFLEGTALIFAGVGPRTPVDPANNFDSADRTRHFGLPWQVATGSLQWAAGFPPGSVSYDIGEGLIHGAHMARDSCA